MTEQRLISTTALAKLLKMSSRRLFYLLKDFDWIAREEDAWQLLKKGEQQGGQYHDSDSFGRYIVWPETLFDHPLLQAAADATQITASGIGDHFQRPARFVNRVLNELGWLRRTDKGWLLTDSGAALGATQLQTDKGMRYASWPRSLLSEPALIASFNAVNMRQLDDPAHEPDLFEGGSNGQLNDCQLYHSIDGHTFTSSAAVEVCQWLYLLGLTHATNRALGGHEDYVCDFYLPVFGVYIDIWYASEKPHDLSERLAKHEWCNEHQITLIELQESEIANIDELLPERLEELGIHVYS